MALQYCIVLQIIHTKYNMQFINQLMQFITMRWLVWYCHLYFIHIMLYANTRCFYTSRYNITVCRWWLLNNFLNFEAFERDRERERESSWPRKRVKICDRRKDHLWLFSLLSFFFQWRIDYRWCITRYAFFSYFEPIISKIR